MQTIRALLSNNQRSQREFRGLRGYELLARVIDAIPHDHHVASPQPSTAVGSHEGGHVDGDSDGAVATYLVPKHTRAPSDGSATRGHVTRGHIRFPSDGSGAGDTACSACSDETAGSATDVATGGCGRDR